MSSARTDKIPWAEIGPSLERLLRYDEHRHGGSDAGNALLATLANDPQRSVWRQFLMDARNFEAVVDHVLDVSRRNAASTGAAVGEARTIAEAALGRGAGHDSLRTYLIGRALLPSHVRARADEAFASGSIDVPLQSIAFAAGLEGQGDFDESSTDVVDHWYREILGGHVSADQAAALPDQLRDAKDRLLAYHAGLRFTPPNDDVGVYSRYAFVLTARDVPAATDTILDAYATGLRIDAKQVEQFFTSLSRDELILRFRMLKDWIGDRYIFGKILTPKLAEFLAQPGDFESLLNELDRLAEETCMGRFRADNMLQRDLELQRYVMEYTKHHAVNRSLPYIDETDSEMYEKFEKMKELPPQLDEPASLTEEHLVEARRSAFEAYGLLEFLRELRASSERPVVVVGNDRYGRQWAVEPLEDFLTDGFSLRYDRAPSHMSTRLTVGGARFGEGALDIRGAWTPDIFPREFARQMGEQMPHVVIVDATSPGKDRGDHMPMFSRANQGYANWFVAFNDVRAEGNGAKYQKDTFLPPRHFPSLLKWHEFVTLRRQLREWVAPGPTYRMALWSPRPSGLARFGETTVTNVAPDLDTGQPQVVFANPVIYSNGTDVLPEDLSGTRPYYFDGPERLVKEKIIFGFGSHGFETRVVGPTTAMFVVAVQRAITTEVARLLGRD